MSAEKRGGDMIAKSRPFYEDLTPRMFKTWYSNVESHPAERLRWHSIVLGDRCRRADGPNQRLQQPIHLQTDI